MYEIFNLKFTFDIFEYTCIGAAEVELKHEQFTMLPTFNQ